MGGGWGFWIGIATFVLLAGVALQVLGSWLASVRICPDAAWSLCIAGGAQGRSAMEANVLNRFCQKTLGDGF